MEQHASELENRIRRALRDPRRDLPVWPDPMPRIRGAARRQRARLALVTTVLAGTTAVIVLLAASWLPATSHRARSALAGPVCPVVTAGSTAQAPAREPGPIIRHLVRPGALATGPQGQLYVADDGLDQLLQVLPGGRFKVIAGNGSRGYSGDGGPAVAAALNDPGGMAVTRNGTIYFADTGNNRVRAVSASGTITTVAGTGRYGAWAAGGGTALGTSLGGPADVAVSPGGCLYLADEGASEVLRLDSSGRLLRVAGIRGAGVPTAGQMAVRAPADGPRGLAFDRAGDLYLAGANTKTLLVITTDGRVRLPIGLAGFYPRGAGGLAAGPDGGIIVMNGQRVQLVTREGLRTLIDFARTYPAGVRGFLPNGIAVGADGTIYLDTYAGNGYAAKTALIEVTPGGLIRVIWQS